MNPPIRVGSRGSTLALWQAHHAIACLQHAHPGLVADIVVIKTLGDRVQNVPLDRLGDRGLFVKEIEEAMLAGQIDLAVHSLKDLPTDQPTGLAIGAILERLDPRDCLVKRLAHDRSALGVGAVIGTSSLRRQAQLRASHPEWQFKSVRGNVHTRLAKLDAGEYDALVLATAGLVRLGLIDRISEYLAIDRCLPAVGQGALALEIRSADRAMADLLRPIDHAITRACVSAERTFLRVLEGGCQVPAGALATASGDRLSIRAMVISLDGDRVLAVELDGPLNEPETLGQRAAASLVARGANDIIAASRAHSASLTPPLS